MERVDDPNEPLRQLRDGQSPRESRGGRHDEQDHARENRAIDHGSPNLAQRHLAIEQARKNEAVNDGKCVDLGGRRIIKKKNTKYTWRKDNVL